MSSSAPKVFQYVATSSMGARESGAISANTFSEARFQLMSQGLQVASLTIKKHWTQIEIGAGVPRAVLLQATRQLASFSQAGIPLAKALYILAESTEHKRMRAILVSLREEIDAGASFSEAVGHHSEVFPAYYVAILDASERSGDITGALMTLNTYLTRDMAAQRAVRAAFAYPIVLIVLALVAMVVVSVLVLPRFVSFFADLNVELPLTTRMLLGFTEFIGSSWVGIFAIVLALAVSFILARRDSRGRVALDAASLKVPVVGTLLQLVMVERFTRVLASLVKTNVPLPVALNLAGPSSGNFAFAAAVEKAQSKVIAGEGLAAPLKGTGMLPAAAIQILLVGEETGALESQLTQASSFYADELDHRLKTLTSLIEPFVLLAVGLAVGFVAIALVSAMYGIYSGIQ